MRRAGAAVVERLPVAPSATRFEADVGPASDGRPTLIYQRYGGTSIVPSGCDLFVYSLAAARGERPVRNANDRDLDDVQPTPWRGRIAWVRAYGSGPDANPVVYTKTLTAPRSRASTRLAGVPQRCCTAPSLGPRASRWLGDHAGRSPTRRSVQWPRGGPMRSGVPLLLA